MKFLLILITLIHSLSSYANEASEIANKLEKSWDQTNFTLENKTRKKALRALITEAQNYRKSHSNNAEIYVWEGVIRSSYYDAAGGIGGLRQVKEAKHLFEKAISMDPNGVNGDAYSALGALYYRITPWPIGFQDKQTASELFQKALTINPNNVEAHYYLGKIYFDKKEWKKSIEILNRALMLPELERRPAYSETMQIEMKKLITEAEAKL